jgi:hypothetical protein
MNTATKVQGEKTAAIEWVSFPFTYAGKSFNSKVSVNSRHIAAILNLPAGVFDTMNAAALRDIATITASTSREEDIAELERINAGSSWAVLELAGE